MNCDQSILHIIMSIGFLSIINMGIDIKIKVLAALFAEILQKDSNTPKSWKKASVANAKQSGFLNDVFEM